MANTRRYVVHGRMPLKRAPNSGLFTTRFKEDAFFLDYSDRAILFNSGARTEQSLQLPYYFVDEGYHMRKRLVESVGFVGAKGRLELYIQYALLPILDPANLEKLRETILERAVATRQNLLVRGEQQALLDMQMLEWCDEPILQFEYEHSNFRLRIKARAPLPQPLPVAARTKRGRLTYYHDYEDLICSKAGYYIVNAFDNLPSVQQIELTLVRMEAEPIHGLILTEDAPRRVREAGLRRLDPNALPPEETPQERKAREKIEQAEARAQAKIQAKEQKAVKKEEKLLAVTQRAPDETDALFDGRLPYESVLLSTRIPRQGFMDLQRSKLNYSARRAMEMFELHLDTDEEATAIHEVEAYF